MGSMSKKTADLREAATAFGHQPKPIGKVIREKCLDCCGGSTGEVRQCPVTKCPLWPYRFGMNPLTRRGAEGEERLTEAA